MRGEGLAADLRPRIQIGDALSVAQLVDLKRSRDLSVSVCLPALDEAVTIGAICERVRALVESGLVDELVVVDSGSSDGTAVIARKAGAEVYEAAAILPQVPRGGGKGGTLWRSLAVLRGDVVVWLDSDTRNFTDAFVTRLLAPLLAEPSVTYTKAFYERPYEGGGGSSLTGGARVTELVVRPLCHLLFPELTGFVQPLSGEYAGYRDDLVAVPFFSGYGVEIGLLIDLVDAHGLASMVQVDLGSRTHRNQDVLALGRMSFQLMQVMTQRAQEMGRLKLAGEWPDSLLQFISSENGPTPVSRELGVRELPPMKSVLSAG